jgi:hypothetical protein
MRIQLSSALQKKRFSFWNYVVSTEKNMELRCVQTQINIILKKIISIYYLDFDRSSREAPAGPDGPPVRICLWANQQTYINAVNLAFSSS